MGTPVLKMGPFLIASIQDALSDADWRQLRESLLKRVGTDRSSGVLVDVSAMDVLDSYATRTLDGMAQALRLRGARTVVVGVRPAVAFAMSQLGLRLGAADCALDLDEGLAILKENGSRG